MYRLVLYEQIEGEGEYVVILSEGEDPKVFNKFGFKVDEIIDIDGDATHFPADRILVAMIKREEKP